MKWITLQIVLSCVLSACAGDVSSDAIVESSHEALTYEPQGSASEETSGASSVGGYDESGECIQGCFDAWTACRESCDSGDRSACSKCLRQYQACVRHCRIYSSPPTE